MRNIVLMYNIIYVWINPRWGHSHYATDVAPTGWARSMVWAPTGGARSMRHPPVGHAAYYAAPTGGARSMVWTPTGGARSMVCGIHRWGTQPGMRHPPVGHAEWYEHPLVGHAAWYAAPTGGAPSLVCCTHRFGTRNGTITHWLGTQHGMRHPPVGHAPVDHAAWYAWNATPECCNKLSFVKNLGTRDNEIFVAITVDLSWHRMDTSYIRRSSRDSRL